MRAQRQRDSVNRQACCHSVAKLGDRSFQPPNESACLFQIQFDFGVARDAVGGKVRIANILARQIDVRIPDKQDGFLLDRGFQVLLTAYPECRNQLDYDRLDLRRFAPGALVRVGDRLTRLADP